MIKVLIVEDDPMVAHINKTYTERFDNFNVIGISTDGKEAQQYIKNKQIDLIILDIYMPKLDGVDLLKWMRKENIMTDVIIVTAAHEVDKLDEVLKFGAIDYLIKPFKYERFKEALQRFQLKYRLIKENVIIKQDDIDKLKGKSEGDEFSYLKKGLNERTLKRVRSYMEENKDKYLTSEEVAEGMSLSRVTIMRYLKYMESEKELIGETKYRNVGRPSVKYKWSK